MSPSVRTFFRLQTIAIVLVLFYSCKDKDDPSGSKEPVNAETPLIDYEKTQMHPHDTTAFTEGFLVNNGELYESTGASLNLIHTKSLFGNVDLKTGKINPKVTLNRDDYFGEGIAFLNGKVYQLTYKTKIGFVYDAATFKKTGDFTFPSEEGWGLTTDGTSLIMSDGTNALTYLEPNTLKPIKTLKVNENGYSRDSLNELEFINGFIYANIWMTNLIVKIDPKTGDVVGKLDLSSLADEAKNKYAGALEMNGIAYDAMSKKVYITGKLWPAIYEIKFNF